MSSYSTLSAVVASCCVLAGCGQPEDRLMEEHGGLLGGVETNARPEVVQVFMAAGCSGTIINARTFVTAAHCLGSGSSFPPVFFGGSIAIVDGTTAGIEKAFALGPVGGRDDIAVGRLTSTTSVTVFPGIARSEPAAGWYTAMGYGCIASRDPGCTLTDRTAVTYHYDGSTPSSITAPGDSGGPLFVGFINDNGPIVRITVGEDTSTGHDVGADAVFHGNDILALDNALNNDGISYRAQVQSIGWMAATQNGLTAGTTGRSLRLESLQVWSPRQGVSVCYRGYVQNIGWQGEVCDGQLAGTIGQSLRMEALQVRLASRPAGTTGVRYQAYLQDIGWQAAETDLNSCSVNANCTTNLCVNGRCAVGTTGQSRRIEAVSIQLF